MKKAQLLVFINTVILGCTMVDKESTVGQIDQFSEDIREEGNVKVKIDDTTSIAPKERECNYMEQLALFMSSDWIKIPINAQEVMQEYQHRFNVEIDQMSIIALYEHNDFYLCVLELENSEFVYDLREIISKDSLVSDQHFEKLRSKVGAKFHSTHLSSGKSFFYVYHLKQVRDSSRIDLSPHSQKIDFIDSISFKSGKFESFRSKRSNVPW